MPRNGLSRFSQAVRRRNVSGRRLALRAIVTAAACVLALAVLAGPIARFLIVRAEPSRADVVVVLSGSSVYDERIRHGIARAARRPCAVDRPHQRRASRTMVAKASSQPHIYRARKGRCARRRYSRTASHHPAPARQQHLRRSGRGSRVRREDRDQEAFSS